jgi:hypothetical protein
MRLQMLLFVLACSAIIFTASCSDNSSTPSVGGLTTDEAVDIVTGTVLPAETSPGDEYICLKMSAPVLKGSTIEEAVPTGMSSSSTRSSAVSFALEEDSYLFFLDLAPASLYEHPVKYIVVEKRSGSYGVTDANWWPKVDGVAPTEFMADVPSAANVVEDTANLPAPIAEEMTFDFGNLGLIWKEGYIVVQGLMPGEKCYSDASATYRNGMNFFNAYKSPLSRVEGLVEEMSDNVPAVIDDMASEGIDLITIYIIAHGNVDWIGLAGHGASPSTFTAKMAQYPDIQFNFLLGSCHGGSFIDNLQVLDNVTVVMTACASDEGAQRDWDYRDGLTDYNVIDSGSEWTSSILYAAGVIANNPEYFSIVEDWAGTYGVPVTSELLYQAHYGAIGQNNGMNLFYNYDLSYRTGESTPQIYHSWTLLP